MQKTYTLCTHYSSYIIRDGSYGYWIPKGRFVEKLSRTLGAVPLVFWGRFFIPFGIPNPRKINVVIGPGVCVIDLIVFCVLNTHHHYF